MLSKHNAQKATFMILMVDVFFNIVILIVRQKYEIISQGILMFNITTPPFQETFSRLAFGQFACIIRLIR